MAEKILRVRICDVPECPTPEDDVRRCGVHINSTNRTFDLCVTHRGPLRELLDWIPRGATRRKTKGLAGKVVPVEEIPKVTTRKRPPTGGKGRGSQRGDG